MGVLLSNSSAAVGRFGLGRVHDRRQDLRVRDRKTAFFPHDHRHATTQRVPVLARLADGAALFKSGDTHAMATSVASRKLDDASDFMPLQ
eukprot:9212237-Pyramimonas_sp.AAC.1